MIRICIEIHLVNDKICNIVNLQCPNLHLELVPLHGRFTISVKHHKYNWWHYTQHIQCSDQRPIKLESAKFKWSYTCLFWMFPRGQPIYKGPLFGKGRLGLCSKGVWLYILARDLVQFAPRLCSLPPTSRWLHSIWDYESTKGPSGTAGGVAKTPIGRPKAHIKHPFPIAPTNLCPPNPPKDGWDAMPSLLKILVWGQAFVTIGPLYLFYLIYLYFIIFVVEVLVHWPGSSTYLGPLHIMAVQSREAMGLRGQTLSSPKKWAENSQWNIGIGGFGRA